MKSVIHDWDDERGVALLRRIRAAMGPTSRVLVVEPIVPEQPGTNAARALEFYAQAFGAKETMRLVESGGTPVELHLHVDDADAVVARAVAAGARVVGRWRTSSTATARARSRIRSATCGSWPRRRNSSRSPRFSSATSG